MGINDNIAQNLNNFMKEKNISANTIAKVGCVNTSTITRFILREIKSLNIETIQKIAAYYNHATVQKLLQEAILHISAFIEILGFLQVTGLNGTVTVRYCLSLFLYLFYIPKVLLRKML